VNKRKEIVHMSNIVHTWKDEANPAGEVELTDAQLVSVYGAQGGEDIWPIRIKLRIAELCNGD
jgi:hypothetical protein